MGESRPNIVPIRLHSRFDLGRDPGPTFIFFSLLNSAKLGASFRAANLDPRFDIPINILIGIDFRDPFLDPENI